MIAVIYWKDLLPSSSKDSESANQSWIHILLKCRLKTEPGETAKKNKY